MDNPTPEECRQLAEMLPEHFEWNSPLRALFWGVGSEIVGYTPSQDKWHLRRISTHLVIDPVLGLAALTAKCEELLPDGWYKDIYADAYIDTYSDNPERRVTLWAALLAAEQQEQT